MTNEIPDSPGALQKMHDAAHLNYYRDRAQVLESMIRHGDPPADKKPDDVEVPRPRASGGAKS